MNKYFLVDMVHSLENATKNLFGNVSYLKYRTTLPKDFQESVSANAKIKNMHKGERCFILGNGPSIKTQDLSLLQDEVVFTVNQASRNPQIMGLKPRYHFWIDPVFFNLDKNKPEDMEVLKTYKDIYNSNNRPVTFLPQQAYSFVKKFELDKEIDIQFFITKVQLGKKYGSDFDFTKAIPSFGTVVQSCIAMAIYMGFSEIYLLGCDSTGIISMISGAMDYNDAQYSYNISENERKRMHDKYSNPEFLKTSIIGFVDLLDTYEKLQKHASQRGIKLINCSAKTIITSIPRKEYEDIVRAK